VCCWFELSCACCDEQLMWLLVTRSAPAVVGVRVRCAVDPPCGVVMARRAADGVALLWWPSGGVSWFAWFVTARACCVLVSGDRLASSPFSWRGWCRCGECRARGIAVGVRVLTRRVSCRHCACVAVVCDAGRCSGGSSDSRSRRGEWSLRPVRRCLACVVMCGVVDALLLSQTRSAATTAPATTAPGTAAAAVSVCCRCCR
jgi:hypothetical protein